MLEVTRPDTGFIALVTLRVDGPERQRELLKMLVGDVEEWVRYCPGFISANYHVSNDGTRLVNYAQWESEHAYRESFRNNPKAAVLREAISSMPGVESPEMIGYTLIRSVEAVPAGNRA